MTQAQWLWEFHALREKERTESEWEVSLLKMFRYMLIKILGLDLLSDASAEEKTDIEDIPFVPFSMLAGRREVIEMVIKKFEESTSMKKALDDTEFDKLSEAIAKGDYGDMEPLFDIPGIDDKPNWHTPAKVNELQSIGVKLTDNQPGANVPHIRFDSEQYNERIRAEAARRAKAIADIKSTNKDLGMIGEPPEKAKGG